MFKNVTVIATSNNHDNIKKQLSEYNIDYNIYDCYESALNTRMYNLLKISNTLDPSVKSPADLNLLYAYYNIINSAYNNNLEHILIFEDSFKLLKKEYMEDFIQNIPYDFDIIQFSILDVDNRLSEKNIFTSEIENEKYFVTTDYNFTSNNGLYLSREGMKFFIDEINKKLTHPYIPIYNSNKNLLRHYISTVPLVYLEKTDKNSYKNIYSLLNKDLYNL